jgi:hypothetical protein
MKRLVAAFFIYIGVLFLLPGCEKKTETFNTLPLSDYYPLVKGKVYYYRLDSTVPAPFGTALLVKSYLAKDTIEATFTDNEGREAFRIFRFIRDTAQTTPWVFASTYIATPVNNRMEYVDNNLRFIKLVAPVTNDYSFKAHTYIDTKSLNSMVPYLDEWEYTYANVNAPFTVRGRTFDSTVTVLQHDETTPEGPFNPNSYQQRNYGVEVYAKGIGLVYKEFLHWTYQTTPPPSKFEDGSYGVKLSLISY